MSGLACAKCFKFLRVKKVGVAFEEGMPIGRPNIDGNYGEWRGYKLWMADLCECPNCGAQVLTGTGKLPIAEHFSPDYARLAEIYPPIGRVNDCGGKRP